MSLRYLGDTSLFAEPVRPRPDPRVKRRLRIHQNELAVPAPAWHEMVFGWQRLPPSRKRDRLEDYLMQVILRGFSLLPYDQEAAHWHAVQRARLASDGRTPPFIDGQIAAIAFVRGLILVTANPRHFEAFEGLQIEDWTAAS